MDRRNRVEWIVLIVSALAVTAVVSLLAYDGLSGTGEPPKPVVKLHLEQAYGTPTGWLLPASVTNEGDQSAQGIAVLATARVNGSEEEAEVSIDYMPAGTVIEITFGFSERPDGEIAVKVTGFLR